MSPSKLIIVLGQSKLIFLVKLAFEVVTLKLFVKFYD
jgi:hypothetical protein